MRIIIGKDTGKRTDATSGRPHRLVDNSSARMNHFSNYEQHEAHAEVVLCNLIPRECKDPPLDVHISTSECARRLALMVEGGAMFGHSEGSGVTSWKSSANGPPGAIRAVVSPYVAK